MHKNGTKKNIKISSNKYNKSNKGNKKTKSASNTEVKYNKTFRNFKPKCLKTGHYILDEIIRFKKMTEETRLENIRRASARKKDKTK